MKKYILVVLPIVLIVIASSLFAYFCYNNIKTIDEYFKVDTKSSVIALVKNQESINEELQKIAASKKYTIDDPYIKLNPYEISPLSAIIIFYTNENVSLDIYINDKLFTTMEKSKIHNIPVYGLYEDFENVIKIVSGNDAYTYKIKTEKSNIKYPLKVKKAYKTDDTYFTVASYETYLTGWDYEGKLRFYLTKDNRMDVEWLDNGHFLIGTSEGQFAENFIGLVEMDYLGKIYNYYVPSNGASFEFQVLDNNEIMLAGGNNPVYVDEQVVYTIDNKGKTKSLMNIAEAVLKIDPAFDSKYLGQKAIRNAFYYNEQTKELLLSFRGWDAILSVDYQNQSINWVFTDPKNELFKNDVWKDYLVKLESGRYPLGQHSVIFTDDGNVAFFNNGYNRLHGFENGGIDVVSYYKNNYSSGEVYNIKNKTAKLVFEFNDKKKTFSHQYGSFKEYDDIYLIDFGYTLKNQYRYRNNLYLSKFEEKPDNIEARIYEVNKKGKVLFEATCEEGKFRAFKHSLYNKETSNINFNELYKSNEIKNDELKSLTYQEIDIDKSIEWINTLTITNNLFITNYQFEDKDVVKLYFVSQNGKTFELDYKKSDAKWKNRVFNVSLSGKFAIFIKVNNTLYNTNQVINFEI